MDEFSWVLLRGLVFTWRAAPDTGRAGVAVSIDLLILPEVWLESLLSGWQENDISHHCRQLISACPVLRFSAGAAENGQVKGSMCESQPCTTGCTCALSVQLHKTAKLFCEGRNISGNPASSMAWELVCGAAMCVTTCSLSAFNYFFFLIDGALLCLKSF